MYVDSLKAKLKQKIHKINLLEEEKQQLVWESNLLETKDNLNGNK